jgi:hypothetical protein
MKNIKFLLFIVCLVFSLNVIFFNCSFATIYILKDQEEYDIWITNDENLVFKYEKLGYVIWILETRGLSQKSLEPESIETKPQTKVALPPTKELTSTPKTNIEPESIETKPQTKVALPPTTKLTPVPKTNINRDKIIDIFKADALAKWGGDYQMVEYEINNQIEAYDWVIKYAKYSDILEKAKQKWGNDYVMVKYEYENQSETYNWINQQKAYLEIMKKAKQKWGVDYVMVKYEYEQQVNAYEWLETNKGKNPEAFKRASNKWGNDYVMVKYEYEK